MTMATAPCLVNGAEIISRTYACDRWIVLCRWAKNDVQHEWVTWCCDNEGNAFWGHYFSNPDKARADYQLRVKEALNFELI